MLLEALVSLFLFTEISRGSSINLVSLINLFLINQVHEQGWRIYWGNPVIGIVQIVDLLIQNGCEYNSRFSQYILCLVHFIHIWSYTCIIASLFILALLLLHLSVFLCLSLGVIFLFCSIFCFALLWFGFRVRKFTRWMIWTRYIYQIVLLLRNYTY